MDPTKPLVRCLGRAPIVCAVSDRLRPRFGAVIPAGAYAVYCALTDIVAVVLTHASRLAVIDLSYIASVSGVALIAELKRRAPITVILGYGAATETLPDAILPAVRAGVDEIAFHEQPRLSDYLKLLVQSRVAPAAQMAPSAFDAIHPLAKSVINAIITIVTRGPNVSDAAQVLGRSVRTLERRFRDARLPPPSVLITLVRMLVVARAAERGAVTKRDAVRAAGYSSPEAFRLAARRLDLGPPARGMVNASQVIIDRIRLEFSATSRDAASDFNGTLSQNYGGQQSQLPIAFENNTPRK